MYTEKEERENKAKASPLSLSLPQKELKLTIEKENISKKAIPTSRKKKKNNYNQMKIFMQLCLK